MPSCLAAATLSRRSVHATDINVAHLTCEMDDRTVTGAQIDNGSLSAGWEVFVDQPAQLGRATAHSTNGGRWQGCGESSDVTAIDTCATVASWSPFNTYLGQMRAVAPDVVSKEGGHD